MSEMEDPGGGSSKMSEKDERMFAMLCPLLAIFAGFVGAGFAGPLVIWLIKREESEFVDYHGKEALNFQLSIFIYMIVSGILTLIVIGILLLIAVMIFNLVVLIQASIKANNGERYRYPLTIRFIS